MTDTQRLADPYSILMAELTTQEGSDFRHTRQTEDRLRELWANLPTSEHYDGLQAIDANVLDIALRKNDNSEEKSLQFWRSSSEGGLAGPLRVLEIKFKEKVDKFMKLVHSRQFVAVAVSSTHARLLQELELVETDQGYKDDIRLGLMGLVSNFLF